MLAGHYTGALLAKGLEPRLPLWLLFLAVQAVDIGWALLVTAGVERVTVDASLPSNPLVLEYMPYTHSLQATLLWAAAAYALARRFWPQRAAALVAFAVASHWLGDLLVHRPDLGLWFDQWKVGLALWDYPLPALALEVGLVIASGAFAFQATRAAGAVAWPAALLAGLLCLVQLGMHAGAAPTPSGSDASALVVGALGVFFGLPLLAWVCERVAHASPPAGGAL